MRSRLFNFLSCLLLSATAAQSAQAVDLTTQRQYYDEAKRALAKGDSGPYMQYSQALADYPLTPYLAYDELTARLLALSRRSSSGAGTATRPPRRISFIRTSRGWRIRSWSETSWRPSPG